MCVAPLDAAKNSGCALDDLVHFLIHLGDNCAVPRATTALFILLAVSADRSIGHDDAAPLRGTFHETQLALA
jgi:hypothetical protein